MRKLIAAALLAAGSLAATPTLPDHNQPYDPFDQYGFMSPAGRWYRDTGFTTTAPDGSIAHAYVDPYNWFWGMDRTPSNENLIWVSEGRGPETDDEFVYIAPPQGLFAAFPPAAASSVPLIPNVPAVPDVIVTPEPPIVGSDTPDRPTLPNVPGVSGDTGNAIPEPVPEPATIGLVGSSIVVWGWMRRRRAGR